MKLLTHYPGQKPAIIDAPANLVDHFTRPDAWDIPNIEPLPDEFSYDELKLAAHKLLQSFRTPNATYPLIGNVQQVADDTRRPELLAFLVEWQARP